MSFRRKEVCHGGRQGMRTDADHTSKFVSLPVVDDGNIIMGSSPKKNKYKYNIIKFNNNNNI